LARQSRSKSTLRPPKRGGIDTVFGRKGADFGQDWTENGRLEMTLHDKPDRVDGRRQINQVAYFCQSADIASSEPGG
jgi:hypothetical protein